MVVCRHVRATQTSGAAAGGLLRRVPNPPLCFVGRTDEARRLATLLSHAPVALVCGEGGVGKSALVQRVVHDQRERAPSLVRVRPNDDFGLLAAELVLAVGRPAEGSPEALAASALSAVEDDARLMVVEDLHLLPPADAARWLALLTGYARRSRWVLTSRVRPSLPEVQEHVVQLGPLPRAAAQALARACRPEADEETLAAIVDAAGGSPLWIRQLAADPSASDLREGLRAEVSRALAMLSVLHEAVPGAPDDPAARLWSSALESLRARGLIGEGGADGRVHDAIAERVLGRLSPAELTRARQDAARALQTTTDAREQLERLRLQLEAGDVEAALSTLSAHRAWIAQGHGPRLWSLLAGALDPRLETTRMQVALAVGTHTSLGWLTSQPRPTRPAALEAWVEGLIRSGRARRAVEELQASPADDVALALLLGRALSDAGYPERAVRHLRALRPEGDGPRARRDLALARAHHHAGHEREAVELARRLRAAFSALPESLVAECQEVLSMIGLEPDEGRRPRSTEGLIYRGIRLATSGRLARSSELFTRVLGGFDLPAGSGVLASVASEILSVARGRYEGLEGRARHRVHEAERLGNATLYHAAYILERVASLGRAWAFDEIPWAPSIPPPTGAPARYLALARVCHRARRGEPIDEASVPRIEASDGPLLACLTQLAEAHVRLLGGDAERACFLAAQAAQATTRSGLGLFQGEAVLTRVYAELALGRRVEVRRGAAELTRVAESLGSKRYRVLAELVRLAVETEPDVPALFRIAGQADASPTAARVASALLGEAPTPDRLDHLLTSALAASWTTRVEPLRPGQAAAWVFDAEARRVHLPRGTLEMSPQACRLLDGMFALGGRASLADLAEVAWALDAFHPLRDSKRIHVAIRRLRRQLEDDASSPTRVLTDPDGYALGAPVGRLVPAAAQRT